MMRKFTYIILLVSVLIYGCNFNQKKDEVVLNTPIKKNTIGPLIEEYFETLDIPNPKKLKRYDEILQFRISSYYENDVVITAFRKDSSCSIEMKIFHAQGLSLSNILDSVNVEFEDYKCMISLESWGQIISIINIDSLHNYPPMNKETVYHDGFWEISYRKGNKLTFKSSAKFDYRIKDFIKYINTLTHYQ